MTTTSCATNRSSRTFKGANADITSSRSGSRAAPSQVQTKLLTLIAAGGAPDVYWVHSYTNGGQAKRNIRWI
ncbi:MAG: hypothetical protein R2851_23045 [Caldilineaceae bacterium]